MDLRRVACRSSLRFAGRLAGFEDPGARWAPVEVKRESCSLSLSVIAAGCDLDPKAGSELDLDSALPMTSVAPNGTDACFALDDGDWGEDLENVKIDNYQVQGYDGSATPPSNSVKAERTNSRCDGATSYRSPSAGSGSIDWYTTGGGGSFLDCGTAHSSGDPCGEVNACVGTYRVDILDSDAATNGLCGKYNKLQLALVTAQVTSRSADVDMDHQCVPGSGRFLLQGLYRGDRDGDGLEHLSLLPLLVDGTGTMTNAAWVRSIDVVEGDPGLLHMMLPGRDIVWGADDRLARPDDAVPVAAHNAFASGTVGGYPVFVVEDADLAALDGWMVDMSWECGTTPSDLDTDHGYVFQPQDLGCPAADQQFVFRVLGQGERVRVELYGNASLAKGSKTWPTGDGGLGFSLHHGVYEVDGVLRSWDEQSATVEITRMQRDGVDVCETGTRVLPAE